MVSVRVGAGLSILLYSNVLRTAACETEDDFEVALPLARRDTSTTPQSAVSVRVRTRVSWCRTRRAQPRAFARAFFSCCCPSPHPLDWDQCTTQPHVLLSGNRFFRDGESTLQCSSQGEWLPSQASAKCVACNAGVPNCVACTDGDGVCTACKPL